MTKQPMTEPTRKARARLKAERRNMSGEWPEHSDALRAAINFLRETSRPGRRWPKVFKYKRARVVFGLRVTNLGCVTLVDRKTGVHIIASARGSV